MFIRIGIRLHVHANAMSVGGLIIFLQTKQLCNAQKRLRTSVINMDQTIVRFCGWSGKGLYADGGLFAVLETLLGQECVA